ncbi:hypothetical protein BJV85_002804 [Clostridium acetobutylicum]|uniref:Uncharacterized protein n=1 Tax=Clostridium acetobutylicum (strain ATCC 824 / DSM 792 / JCM 1419 / IAM 19013 / LMG 5710 / NBRC 13948 / NRRL B-527 / VKM B-1787 / 2291 / W) TaxID=272562 RepID=Q97JS9_CLOAB|nr:MULTISPECIES: hypothetical protein [Clostridium]AAK79166.1 Hypothetical protein CA_C1194 [Clostridium acetobutylicum ATCC 824]ADZ20244.1 Conserved hypothetical protein [Clostridium acetobutylicum EA 2018]AEI31701.1 hypothetical protein SMB_G1214 [Clostridium acetobutylicum DSM 1731]AWV81583.1 hypothetical protein DK921_16080 [Clostridium acetobutylicum]MBC2393222.1 hypothetical protein [Clostridium acetobutylicum]
MIKEKIEKDEGLRKLINELNSKKQILRVGIVFFNDDINMKKQYDFVKNEIDELIISTRLYKECGEICTKTTSYKLLKFNSNVVRGQKFHKIYYEKCSKDILTILYTMICSNSENRVRNPIEEFYIEDNLDEKIGSDTL